MGRPIPKKNFGRLDTGAQSATNPTADGYDGAGHTLTDADLYSVTQLGYNIPVYAARVPGLSAVTNGTGGDYPYIVSQKGSHKYRVRTSATAAHIANCTLVDKLSGLSEGEMVIQGWINGNSGSAENGRTIKKLTKHYATDFNGVRYKWYVDYSAGEDSTQSNVLVLVTADSASTVRPYTGDTEKI